MQPDVSTGTVLAGFRVLSLIGEGAMGRVYLAEPRTGSGQLALKLLAPELARDERYRQRFLRESRLVAELDHPHIVPTIASGEENGLLYLVMRYVAGSDLRQLLRREGRLQPERALDLLGQAAQALDAAHAAGLVHRDVKPGNILVSPQPEGECAYVCDFGLARHVSSASSLTGERGFVGTIDYVPPEQIEGGAIDGRADVYSLGCVLYECLVGERPFDRESELSVLFAHLNEPAPPLSDFMPELPAGLDAVLATALAKNPAGRFSTCGELVEAARAALEGRPIVRRTQRRQRRILLGAAVVTVTVGVTIGGVLAAHSTTTGSRSTATLAPALTLAANAVSLIDARTRRVVSRIWLGAPGAFGTAPWDVGFVGRSAWVLSGGAQRLEQVDLKTRTVRRTVKLPWGPGSRMAIGGGAIWLTQDAGPEVLRLDARNGKVLDRFAVAGRGAGIAFGAGSLWLARDGAVVRIDPRNGRVRARIPLRSGPSWVLYADGAAWAASGGDGYVARIDPAGNRVVLRQLLHGYLSDLAVGGGFVWASIVPDGTIFKLSETDLSVQSSVRSGSDPQRISFGGGRLWITNSLASTVSLLEPVSGTRSELAVTSEPTFARYYDGLVWAGGNPALRPLPPVAGQELRISTPKIFTDADPSTGTGPWNGQLFYAACANLLGYPDAGGARGARLRPEIAAAMPTVSPDRRTYTFNVRTGFRFSPPSNEPVTAATFRHTIERALSPKLSDAPAEPFASDIVGAAAYRAGKAAHISGIVARGNTLSITLLRPAGDFLNRISLRYFCPVPLSQPVVPGGLTGPIPSAGPYYVALMDDSRTVLLRNPNYVGNRPRRSARIVFSFGTPTPEALAQVQAGRVELLSGDFDPYSALAPGGPLDRSYGAGNAAAQQGRQRYFLEPAPFVHELVFNTNRPLFREPRLRRAVEYALDRVALAGVLKEAPADKLVPPAVPGFHAGGVYPLRGPDLAAARRLAGPEKHDAVLYTPCGSFFTPAAELVRSNLAKIGITVSIVGSADCPDRYSSRMAGADLLLAWLGTDPSANRDPVSFVDQALEAGRYGAALGPGPWRNPSVGRHAEQARALGGRARLQAYRRLASELMRAAPVAVFGSAVTEEYVSPRVGCKIFQGALGFLDLGALCVR